MDSDTSEIDDENFFLAPDGKTNAKSELKATLNGLLNEKRFDDNSTACRFPARKDWLQKELNITTLPEVKCLKYNKLLKRLNPKSVTLVFPSAHINSPASMFGHTFLRINSAYQSKLLSYAVNYAANANPDTENGVVFAIKGLFGGYYGSYSLLPYYDKLKEYRDTEQRDIWEYDLNLDNEEVLNMVKHIWELNRVYSKYYFFTQNCSYNMLWLLEIARPNVNLRDYFNYQVPPLETVYVSAQEDLLSGSNYRASKRTKLLKYESLINSRYLKIPTQLVQSELKIKHILNDKSIITQQKMYILEAAIELLEYFFTKNKIDKKYYLEKFHRLTKARATLGIGQRIEIDTPVNPIHSHRAVRTSLGYSYREEQSLGLIGLRPAYHSLEDIQYGLLRGTQIEFMDLMFNYKNNQLDIENITLLSIASIAQRSAFFKNFSWRTNFSWDREYLDSEVHFQGSIGAGYSWGNDLGYIYFLLDPLFHYKKKIVPAINGSIGLMIDKYNYMNTNIEVSQRWYEKNDKQVFINLVQSFRVLENFQVKFKYMYKKRWINTDQDKEITSTIMGSYYF